MVANIVTEQDPQTLLLPAQDYLSGSTVSSLHRLRDIDNSDGGFFVFGDLAVKKEGRFRLQFSLFEILDGVVHTRKTMLSNAFTVYLPKHFPGPVEATFLSRTFSDQGVKMRIRKEHRMQSRKRKNIDEADNQQKKSLKRSGMLISTSPPPYSSMNPSDVFFGRWQATTDKSRQSSISTSSSSMDDHDYRALTNKFKYQSQTIPSPESTTYTNSINSMDPSPYSVSHSSCFANKQVLPYLSQSERLPTPPNVTDHHMTYHWGTRLPPLRTIMNDDYKHSSMTLILPPPSSIIPSYVIEPYSRR
ncbi:hypothetical protein BCV72DRAFT_203637 [Rhizopus microsporus var. microsporus]|nr:hypothetical protein BCV72DRAFT_203637 [Rhizopus microsporus var. microsporus]